MPDHPILFSGPMVRAILEGRKTKSRRILKEQPEGMHLDRVGPTGWQFTGSGGLPRIPFAPKYAPGDRLWVREAFMPLPMEVPPNVPQPTGWVIAYGAGGQSERIAPDRYNPVLYNYERWTPSIHMPRWASRITLLVEAVKVERLQDISSADTIAEGAQCATCQGMNKSACSGLGCFASRQAFRTLWESINGPESWTANPWVAAYTFKPIFQNIDTIRKEAA